MERIMVTFCLTNTGSRLHVLGVDGKWTRCGMSISVSRGDPMPLADAKPLELLVCERCFPWDGRYGVEEPWWGGVEQVTEGS